MKKILPIVFLLFSSSFFAQQKDSGEFNESTTSYAYTGKTETKWLDDITESDLYKVIENHSSEGPFTSELLQKRLEALHNSTPFEVAYNPTVERIIRLYLNERKETIANLMDKAQYFFPIFEEYLDKYNLPLEIKYLAIVESALEPNAKSVAGARGLWQFMYHTGKQYGLKITSFVDERADPIKSTEAACKYLRDLYEMFGDWDLAIAAYNSGPGNVSKAIKRSGGLRNFWNIRQFLPEETRGYLPAFYATFYLFEYGDQHGISPKNMRINYFDTDTVHVKERISFDKIRKITQIDPSLLSQLNPQYKLSIIPFDDGNKVLTLPKGYIDSFIAGEQNYLDGQGSGAREAPAYITPNEMNSYTVHQGDNFSRIANKFNITIAQLKKWNGLQTDYIIEGQRLVITDKTETTTAVSPEKSQDISYETYTVKEGDSLFLISKRFPDTSISQLRSWNNLWGVNYIKPGTKLKIKQLPE